MAPATLSPLAGAARHGHGEAMNQTQPPARPSSLIRTIGCLAYPAGAAIVGGLVYMILRLVQI